MRRVELGSKSIETYRALIGDDGVACIQELAAPLRGARVLHVNATAVGGGVAELLPTIVSLKRGLGLEAEWHVLSGSDPFFELTKKLHNGLQGMEIELAADAAAIYLATLEQNVELFSRDWDYVVVHDPQPAGLTGLLNGRRTGAWIWRCHIDTSTPNAEALGFLAPYVGSFDASIFTLQDYVTPELAGARTEFIYPSINPLSPKNQAMAPPEARAILDNRFGIDRERPLITQVSRYDPWKDPIGVIDAFRLVRERMPDVQLALVGNVADDDPEGVEFFRRTVEHAGGDPDIYVLSTLDQLSREALTHALEVNAFQSGSDVIVQKSTREGFGLVVAEAMWKGAPVVGGRAGGIVHQIEDGESGCLVSSVEECAERVVELLEDPATRRRMGARARESVRERFLTPRHLADYLKLFRSL